MASSSFEDAIISAKSPLRLIDIAATLSTEGAVCFSDPKFWPPEKRCDFHVLSHTWSKQLKEFSEKIGKHAADMGLTLSQGYNEAFRNASLQNEDCYRELRKVLELLRGDGVEHVWYDMLCINQADEDKRTGEKAQEIKNMASYYHHNKGCYVLLHGVGQGYKLWKKAPKRLGAAADTYWKGSRPSIPRWFTRVWTFQEYVLPKRLIFIVEGLGASTKAHLNNFIRKFSHDPNNLMMCCCVASDSSSVDVQKYRRIAAQQRPTENQQQAARDMVQEEVLGACDHSRSCGACGITEPLIRKVKDEDNLYFVNGKAYPLLVDLDWGESASHQREFLNTLMQLHLLAADFSCQVGRIALVIQEISRRKCTRDEDRVLSILGLMQVPGEEQVRTGEQLEDQLMTLPPKLLPEILVQLCSASDEGGLYDARGLSWAPNLTLPSIKESLFDIAKFPLVKFVSEQGVVIEALQPNGGGRLKFKGKVIKGRIVPLPRRHIISHERLSICCHFCRNYRDHPYSSLDLHQIAQCHLELGNKVRLLLDVHFFFGSAEDTQALHKVYGSRKIPRGLVDVGNDWFESMRQEDEEDDDYPVIVGNSGFHSIMQDDEENEDYLVINSYDCAFTLHLPEILCAHALPSFDVWILRVGRTQTSNLKLLLCLGNLGSNQGCELHKIGTLSLPPHVWDRASKSTQDPMKECILGGFGRHTICKLWEALVKPPYMCYPCSKKLETFSLRV